ncbi:MAG: hypothetical protein LBD10_06775 [Desulfobulbus sp.]|jgi:hypothetical protein|uniref:hypothetical protein n=1 Tax=Desulfobulbus sp. TaxID=895 RepID=UPI002851DDF2|nr:hypothetical protein [Desulfobulbus sp.]MDR2549882.1 hypothetical protein [Desulfobulbus sp.]
MKMLYLAQIDRQLFAVDKECVIGVGSCNGGSFKPIEEKGRQYLPLPHGDRAVICDVGALMAGHGDRAPLKRGVHYLIVAHDDQALALVMTGKGRIVAADVAATRPLPPAFTSRSRTLVPGVLINGIDMILLLDLQTVLETTTVRHGQAECRVQEKR